MEMIHCSGFRKRHERSLMADWKAMALMSLVGERSGTVAGRDLLGAGSKKL